MCLNTHQGRSGGETHAQVHRYRRVGGNLPLAVSAASAAPPSSKNSSGTIVMVFKDGHRQSFNLSDIEGGEFPAGARVAEPSAANSVAPPRGQYVGRWECGDGNGGSAQRGERACPSCRHEGVIGDTLAGESRSFAAVSADPCCYSFASIFRPFLFCSGRESTL